MSQKQSMPKWSFENNLIHAASCCPVFLWGHPGVGKTSRVEYDAKQAGAHVVVLIASQSEPAEFAGWRSPPKGGEDLTPVNVHVEKWFAELHKHAKTHKYVVLFFDELNSSDVRVLRAIQNILTSRRVGGYPLPRNCVIIAAGNPTQSGTGVMLLSMAVLSRVAHYWFEPSIDDFVNNFPVYWGNPVEVVRLDEEYLKNYEWWRTTIAEFIKQHPNLLFALPQGVIQSPWPCQRTWDLGCRLAASKGINLKGSSLEYAFASTVGHEAFSALVAFLNNWRLPSVAELVDNPTIITKLSSSQAYGCLKMLVSHAIEKAVRLFEDPTFKNQPKFLNSLGDKIDKEMSTVFKLSELALTGQKLGSDLVCMTIRDVPRLLCQNNIAFNIQKYLDVLNDPEVKKIFAKISRLQ
jgi:hypothetical protein